MSTQSWRNNDNGYLYIYEVANRAKMSSKILKEIFTDRINPEQLAFSMSVSVNNSGVGARFEGISYHLSSQAIINRKSIIPIRDAENLFNNALDRYNAWYNTWLCIPIGKGIKRAKKGNLVVPISTAKLANKYKKSGGAKEYLNSKIKN